MNAMLATHSPEALPERLGRLSHDTIALLARLSMASTFWLSGQSKIEGLVLDPIGLQAEWGVPHVSEVGLASRLSALALLGMTAVIQLFVYPGAWPTHALWSTCLLYLIARGPGKLSLDHLIARRWR